MLEIWCINLFYCNVVKKLGAFLVHSLSFGRLEQSTSIRYLCLGATHLVPKVQAFSSPLHFGSSYQIVKQTAQPVSIVFILFPQLSLTKDPLQRLWMAYLFIWREHSREFFYK